jgi:xanthine dehydrogenase small subunit
MALSFLLNGEPRSVEHAPPTMTVLDYLRGVVRLTGTKEGCAEGDCGACTIAVARPANGATRYEAVNSCLMMLPQLDGCAVLTVEGLQGAGGRLHPVQQALVDADATQCGFCTPGFVMAMFAFQQTGEPADDATIHDALAGNLCRCTGYRPIVEACRRLPRTEAPAPPAPLPRSSEYRHGEQVFLTPSSVAELAELCARHPDALILGGGTDLGLLVSKERKALPLVISTAGVAELRRIDTGGGTLSIGGAVTYTEALPHLERHFPSFAELVRRIGSRQIRNLGTLAGNLATASPIGDTLPCLFALDADIRLHSQRGPRRLPVEKFILGYRKTALAPGEFIEAIEIPLLREGQSFVAYKLSKRFDQDISAVIAAFRLRVRDGRLEELRAAYGGMGPACARATQVEAALTGKPWTAAALAAVDAVIARDFSPISDQRASAAYRLRAAANLLRRLQAETTAGGLTRVEAL